MSADELSLTWMLDRTLPLNRKERYFTGTVLPGLVCADGMAHLHRLTALLGHPRIEVTPNPENCGVLFFTEYGLAESCYGPSAERLRGLARTKETPDVLFLVLRPRPVLFALEAKLFDRPGGYHLRQQLDRQRALLEPVMERLATWLHVESVELVHYALLPRAQAGVSIAPYRHITWEQVHDAFADVAPAYWLAVLREALARYPDLVTKAHHNDDDRLTGREILESYLAGTLEYTAMGRTGGLDGDALGHDLAYGRWLETTYQVAKTLPSNSNWFTIASVVSRLGFHHHDGASPVATLVEALTTAESVLMRVRGEGSIARQLVAGAEAGHLDAAEPELLIRVAGLYRLAAEVAKHARREASPLYGLLHDED